MSQFHLLISFFFLFLLQILRTDYSITSYRTFSGELLLLMDFCIILLFASCKVGRKSIICLKTKNRISSLMLNWTYFISVCMCVYVCMCVCVYVYKSPKLDPWLSLLKRQTKIEDELCGSQRS